MQRENMAAAASPVQVDADDATFGEPTTDSVWRWGAFEGVHKSYAEWLSVVTGPECIAENDPSGGMQIFKVPDEQNTSGRTLVRPTCRTQVEAGPVADYVVVIGNCDTREGGQGGNDSKMVRSSTAAICNVQDVSKRAMAGFVVNFSKGCGISLHAGCAYTNT